jgi:hypothetical protein
VDELLSLCRTLLGIQIVLNLLLLGAVSSLWLGYRKVTVKLSALELDRVVQERIRESREG